MNQWEEVVIARKTLELGKLKKAYPSLSGLFLILLGHFTFVVIKLNQVNVLVT
jgi:hypothetical protein